MSSRIHQLFRPTRVAVVGASTTNERAGNIIIKNLRAYGFLGDIYPINPNGGAIEGLPACPTVLQCPLPPDLVIVAVPHQHVARVVEEAAEAGGRHIIVASGGFADAGVEGRARQDELVKMCRRRGVTLMGPNSIGTIDAKFGFCASIGKLPPMPPSGISLLGQTGTFSSGYALEEITCRGRGFSKIACLGNKGDVDESDFLEYYAADEDTDVIGAYIESAKDGLRFFRAACDAARRKPLVILKGGRTAEGAKAAASHTGGLAGADAVFDGVFRQAGAQRVRDFREFFGALRALDMCVLPRGPRVGVVSITGVGCVLTADACADYGLQLATISERTQVRLQELTPAWATIGNPADIWSTIEQLGAHEAYQRMCSVMIEDERVDILLLIAVLLEEGEFDSGAALAPVKKAHPGKPILACRMGGKKNLLEAYQLGLERIGIPVYDGPGEAIAAAARLWERAQIVGRFAGATS